MDVFKELPNQGHNSLPPVMPVILSGSLVMPMLDKPLSQARNLQGGLTAPPLFWSRQSPTNLKWDKALPVVLSTPSLLFYLDGVQLHLNTVNTTVLVQQGVPFNRRQQGSA